MTLGRGYRILDRKDLGLGLRLVGNRCEKIFSKNLWRIFRNVITTTLTSHSGVLHPKPEALPRPSYVVPFGVVYYNPLPPKKP